MQFQDSWVSGLALRYLEVKSLDLAPGSYLEVRCLGHLEVCSFKTAGCLDLLSCILK